MKKLLLIAPLILTLLLASLIASLYALSQTRYATALGNYLLENKTIGRLVDGSVQVETFTYNAPFHFSLEGVQYQPNQPLTTQSDHSDDGLYIPQVDIWLNQTPYQNGKWVVDSLLIDGLSLQQLTPSSDWQDKLALHQIALNNFDLSTDNIIARGVNIQVKKPYWQHENQLIPFGEIQLSSQQLYYQGEALDNLLVNANYKEKDSTIFGVSFDWRGADISGQAEQYDHGWSLINVTLNKLDLHNFDAVKQLRAKLSPIVDQISHINSLDILNSHFSTNELQATNLDLSIENVVFSSSSQPEKSWLWQQKDAYLSFNAESLMILNQQFLSPMAKLQLTANRVSITELDSDFLQGRIQLSGQVTPTTTQLDWLRASGMKLVENSQQSLALLWRYIDTQDTIDVKQLDILRSQVIQIETAPFWQLSGVNMSGRNLELKRDNTLGLWHGELEMSANSLSFDDLIATQAVLKSNASDGAWELERLFIPLQNGYLDASGFWQLSSLSRPWQLIAHGDGLPLNLINRATDLPIKFEGLTEFEASATGLSGNQEMLAHSLEGSLKASTRGADFTYSKPNGYGSAQIQTQVVPFSLNSLEITSDRGRVTITEGELESSEMNGVLLGEIDLVAPENGNITLSAELECQQLSFDLLKGSATSHHQCP
ncbi:AsmA family protein [uncultured Vibrio sp.]|uniref:AsmA family protein n=1 Tax=uncultured Vibrio sp. TaxID=114054 RepID=UPI0025D6D9B9|nr:AsmA family protein [uncultured Vibrio sp.]